MKTLKLVHLILAILFLSSSLAWSQSGRIVVNPSQINPANPLPSDSVYIKTNILTANLSLVYYKNITIYNDTIDIQICVYITRFTQPKVHLDTFVVAPLPSGFYTVICRAYETSDSLCENKYDSASSITTFTVGVSNSIPQAIIGDSYQMSLYPNPAHGSQTLRYKSTKPELLSINLTDLSGRVITKVIDAEVAAGDRTIAVDVSSLARGLYFYRIRIGEWEEVLKMVKH